MAVAPRRSLLTLLALAACARRPRPAAPSPAAPARWERTVTLDRGALVVATCFGGAAPARLRVRDGSVAVDAHARPGGARLSVEGGAVALPPGADCFEQRLPRAEFEDAGGALLVPHSAWLWAPEPLAPGTVVRTRFLLPAGHEVTVPWPREGGVYAMDATAFAWEGYTVLGPFAREEVAVDGTVFDVAKLGALGRARLPLAGWLGGALRNVRRLDPSTPLPRVQVVLVPSRRGSGGVSFGLVSRGGGPSVTFVVDPGASEAALLDDWQSTHEFVHLVHPVLLDADAWLREGLATYYQEVLRARSGRRSPAQAWAALRRGLGAGEHLATGRTLAEESAGMARTHAYVRVYWWGTALMLRMDVALRRATGGRASLDDAVRALQAEASRAPERAWSAREAVALFDRAAGAPVCEPIAREALASERYPGVDALLAELGVRAGADGAVTLDDAAPLAAVRDAIMRGDGGGASSEVDSGRPAAKLHARAVSSVGRAVDF